MNVFWNICMCQREWKEGEHDEKTRDETQSDRKKSTGLGKKEAEREKIFLQIGKTSVYNTGGIF